jgi:hypothetical protein
MLSNIVCSGESVQLFTNFGPRLLELLDEQLEKQSKSYYTREMLPSAWWRSGNTKLVVLVPPESKVCTHAAEY